MDEVVKLTRQEIGDAIVNYIGTFKKGMSFFPYKITGTDYYLSVQDVVPFTIEYIPKGTKSKDCQHNF